MSNKLWDIVKTVGSTALQVALPGTGSAIVAAVNEFLPDDSKLPGTATGNDAVNAIQKLSPEAQASVMNKQFDVDIERLRQQYGTIQTMLTSDATMQHTTRPYIAKGAFHVVAFVTIVTISIWSYAIATGDDSMVTAVVNGWPFILGVVGPLVVLLHAYFGVLRKEQQNKLNAANGHAIVSGISSLFKKKG